MLIYCQGDIFLTKAQCIAHGCNTLGKMGAGIAKEMRALFPAMYEEYKKLCKSEELKAGDIFVYTKSKPYILNFMTQCGFYNAKLEYISQCLNKIKTGKLQIDKCQYLTIDSVAMPKIGCNLGKLNWNDVHKLIKDKLENIGFPVFIYKEYIPKKFSFDEEIYWRKKEEQNEKERIVKTNF